MFKGFQRIFQFFQSSKVTKDHLSVVANPPGPADPMNVFLDLGGHVEVHHIGNLVEWCLSMVYQLRYQNKTNCGIKTNKQNKLWDQNKTNDVPFFVTYQNKSKKILFPLTSGMSSPRARTAVAIRMFVRPSEN